MGGGSQDGPVRWALADQYAEFYSDFLDREPKSRRGDGRAPAAKRLQKSESVLLLLGAGGKLALAEHTPKNAVAMVKKVCEVRASKPCQIQLCQESHIQCKPPRQDQASSTDHYESAGAQELKKLSGAELKLSEGAKGERKLGDLSPFLAEFDGDAGDGQHIVIPGQHITRPNAASEDECDPDRTDPCYR